MLKRLEKQEALQLYQDYLQKDFVKDPLPPFKIYKKFIEEGKYQAYYYIEEEPKAYVITVENEDYIMLLFFAVFEGKRGSGIGTKAIQELQIAIQKDKTIIIEVEQKTQDMNQKEQEIVKRRKRFYERLGFKQIEPLKYKLQGHAYDIMTYGKEQITPEEIKKLIPRLYQNSSKNLTWLEIE